MARGKARHGLVPGTFLGRATPEGSARCQDWPRAPGGVPACARLQTTALCQCAGTPLPSPPKPVRAEEPRAKGERQVQVTFHQHQDHISQDGQGCPQDQDGEEEGADGVYILVLWLQREGKAELGLIAQHLGLPLPSRPALHQREGCSRVVSTILTLSLPPSSPPFILCPEEWAGQITAQGKARSLPTPHRPRH